MQRANGGPGLLGLIKIVVNIHRLLAGPHLAHGVEEGVGAGVALVVVEIIAIPALLGIVAAADDMDRQPAPNRCSRVANLRAARVGETKPGR